MEPFPQWILVVLMLLEYPKLHLCRRYRVSSSVISSHKSRVPEYCRNSFETIRCYELCKDDPSMTDILRMPPHTHGDSKYRQALKIKKAEEKRFYDAVSEFGLKPRPGVEFPCENKCESDPLYWACMQECDRRDHTSLWDQNCYEPITPLPKAHCLRDSNWLPSAICQSCLTNATRDMLNETCEISYLPDTLTQIQANLCHKMSTCGTPMTGNIYAGQGIDRLIAACVSPNVELNKTAKYNVEVLKMCVNDRIMVYQYYCCHSAAVRNATMCRDDTEKCDDVCMKLLNPRLCRETCKQLRNTNIDKCLNTTCEFQNPFSPDICDHCTNINKIAADTKTCLTSNNRSNALETCIRSHPLAWLQRNCHTYNYLHRFEEFIRKKVNHAVRTNDYSWMHSHLTPIECIDKCSADSASNATNGTTTTPTLAKQCRECVEEEKSPEEIETQCRTNPFRTIDMLACAIERNIVDLKFDSVVLLFAPRLSACSNDTLRLALYQLAFTFEEEEICPMDCVGGETGYHPNQVGRMKCQIDICQETGKSPFCQPHTDGHVVQLPEFASCRWKVDFAKAENPSLLWATYFNELGPSDIKDKLEHPDTTNLLQKSVVNGKEAFYTFPYFIVIRGICDNGHYEDGAFRFFMTGGIPTVELRHLAPTTRHEPKSLIRTIFQSALIKLRRNEDDDLVPENPRNIDGEGDIGCHENICYPAFAVPLMFLHLPHFQVVVSSQEVFADLKQTIYVAAFHSRSEDGKGAIQIALGDYPTHPGMLFPKERGTFAIDSELSYHASCFADDETDNTKDSFALLKCPELEHVLDDFDRPYDANYFYPLTVGDIFRAQYTHGTAHVQAIAGFYDPRFLIIGDADMTDFEIVNWAKLLKQMEKKQKPKLHACVQPNFKHRGFEKPIYSQLDRTDTDYPINYYRQRYAPLHYNKGPENITKYTHDDDLADTAIFEAIALEDRLLLVTSKGLVSFYGHTNATVRADKAWTYSDEEVLNRCFKFVKILRKAQPTADTIVGITYDYVVRNVDPSGPRFTEISQQIWVGTFTYAGKDIEWREIKPNPQSALVIEERVSHDTLSPGELMKFEPGKEPGLPYETREASPKSQIEAICYKAFRTQISKASSVNKVALYDEPGWCEAIDATPVVLKPNAIQVLVRLRVYHNPPSYKSSNPGSQISYTDPRVYFYIVASHSVKEDSIDSAWFIDSIIPRFPCIDEHREAVKNVLNFDENYFHSQGFGGSTFQGCHSLNRKSIDFHIHLNGMTYSRALSNHLFLYGSRLLHSTDNGRSFVGLRSFPQRLDNFNEDNYYNYSGSDRLGDVFRRVHRIELMAFDDLGHYAFLTNKLELWFGSTGSINQIRMRPSPLRSMVQLGISKVRNINDGVPFSIHFDSGNLLYEMVAIVDENGQVSRIMKRPVGEWKILRVKHILQKLDEHSAVLVKERKGQKKLTESLQKPYNYALAKWTAFCAFVSPKLRQNYSTTHSRTQVLYFPQPVQHLSLGKSHTVGSLMTFQASTFAIIWSAYFNIPNRLYAGRDKDPFEVWIQEKRDQAILGLLKFSQMQPESHGIVVQPRKYKRTHLYSLHSGILVTNYFIDLGMIIELRLEFSIKNDVMAIDTDFEAAQLNEIQLNVENANGSIIQINTEKELNAHIAAVLFVVKFSVKRKTSIPQNLPGQFLQPVVMTFHLIGAFGNCINDRANGIMGDSIQTVAIVGCPPSRDFVFNWNATLSSIKFRDKTVHGTNERCHEGEFVCFFARNPLVLFFDIFDESQQKFIPYTGKYTLRVIGGGRHKELMVKYSTEEIEAYNIPGVSDVSLVWNEWDSVNHQKVDKKVQPLYSDEGKLIYRDNREMILDAGVSTILWACHTLSPCARIRPTNNLEVVYWFRLSISNRDVDNGTLCLYEKEFDIMLYGFPPSPEFQLLTTLGFSCCLLGIMYICFRCCRAHRRLWRTTKTNMKNLYHIVKDAFPKKLRLHEPAIADEEKLHKKKATDSQENILDGSITSSTGWRGSADVSPRLASSASSMSVESVSTTAESSQVLPDNKPNLLPAATKEIIYDQILTRRLNSIVVRNRAMRQNLIKKASIQVSAEDLETEAFFEKQFGRTVSQESVFTPPMPKDKKRGIDSFF